MRAWSAAVTAVVVLVGCGGSSAPTGAAATATSSSAATGAGGATGSGGGASGGSGGATGTSGAGGLGGAGGTASAPCDGACAPESCCDGVCVDLATDAANCGACGKACEQPVPEAVGHGPAVCYDGACKLKCNAGRADCDGVLSNGCETDTANDLANCGKCGRVCALVNADAAHCNAYGLCDFTCTWKWRNCDADGANGCETDTSSDPSNCGACAIKCTDGKTCKDGVCAF